MKEFRNPPTVHPPLGSYSHQVELRGLERLLFLSGQVGMQPDGTLPADPIDQLQVAFENLERNLAAAGMGLADLVKITFYLAGEWDTARRRQATAAALQDHHPCMTLLYVTGLATPDLRVELDAWASQAG